MIKRGQRVTDHTKGQAKYIDAAKRPSGHGTHCTPTPAGDPTSRLPSEHQRKGAYPRRPISRGAGVAIPLHPSAPAGPFGLRNSGLGCGIRRRSSGLPSQCRRPNPRTNVARSRYCPASDPEVYRLLPWHGPAVGPEEHLAVVGDVAQAPLGEPAPASESFTASGVRYEPYIGASGQVGYRMTRGDKVEYLYFNPSEDDGDGGPEGGPGANVFVYQGETGNPGQDGSVHFYYVLEDADWSEDDDE